MTLSIEDRAAHPQISAPFGLRVLLLMGAGWTAGFLAIAIVALGLDFLTDSAINLLFQTSVPNGELRLAGISAPLSEEIARLIGILGSVGGIGWWIDRAGIEPVSMHLSGRIPWGWFFGMNAGLAFAIVETITNGDPSGAIPPRALAHGTYAAMVTAALLWAQSGGSKWSILLAVGLSMALHGTTNALRSIGEAAVAGDVLRYTFSVVLVSAVWAAWLRPDIFGRWRFGVGRGWPEPEGGEVSK